MQLKIGKNEIEFLKEYPKCKVPSAKEIVKKLEAIGLHVGNMVVQIIIINVV